MQISHKNNSFSSCEHDAQVLHNAVEKLMRYGQQAGVAPEDMLGLLDFGLSMPQLIGFLAAQGPGAA